MDEQKLEQSLTKLLEGQENLAQRIVKLEESPAHLTQSSAESLEAELEDAKTNLTDASNMIDQLRQGTAERFATAFEQADLDPEHDVYAQRIFDAIRAKGYDISPHKEPAQVNSEQENGLSIDYGDQEESEPTIVDGKRDGDGWRFLENIGMSIREG